MAGGIAESLTGLVGGEGDAGVLDGFASLIFGGWLSQGASASPACACLGTGVALVGVASREPGGLSRA